MESHKLGQRTLVSGCRGGEHYNTQLLYFTCSSLSSDDRRLYLISDRDGNPNVYVHDMLSGKETPLTTNRHGTLKSYVYFACNPGRGLGKASVCLDPQSDTIFYIQDNLICCVGTDGQPRVLNRVPDGRMTAFTHVSSDGRLLCVPMTDGRILDYDTQTEGSGLDLRPVYNIDGRVQQENLSSYLCVYDTLTGRLLYEKRVPRCWITHVQFCPTDPELIMYNHEWASADCGIRRIWLYNHRDDTISRVRSEGGDTLGDTNGHRRSREDWVCHEMWTDDGRYIIYHGGYADGPAMVGRYELATGRYWEIALPPDYDAYGHFTMNHQQQLCCDGYFKFVDDVKPVWHNSTDNGPDPHKKDGEYISQVLPDWAAGKLHWRPLCKHLSDWMGQDAHPHPIYSHRGDRIFFNSREGESVRVFSVNV